MIKDLFKATKEMVKYFRANANLIKKHVPEFFAEHEEYFEEYYKEHNAAFLKNNKNKSKDSLACELIGFSTKCASTTLVKFKEEVNRQINFVMGKLDDSDLKENLVDAFHLALAGFINQLFAKKLNAPNFLGQEVSLSFKKKEEISNYLDNVLEQAKQDKQVVKNFVKEEK